ncbi:MULTISPECIES: fumarylacetoacetate hydrolase family protein [unclassified Streptomyces]|uniref:fumarylacetoacetate hydrolase family protein n=1 Tax=unclassified Streptomyces TaxID=2593676 RepID=UPI00382FC736
MRIANLSGRAVLLDGAGATDIATASGGRFGPGPQSLYDDWEAFSGWARDAGTAPAAVPCASRDLGAPVPEPVQAVAIGLNYQGHREETHLAEVHDPDVFTKFRSCFTGPEGPVALPEGTIDWEAELVVVMGREARHVSPDDAWSYVAGLTAGQDLSERTLQFAGPSPQWSIAKSHPDFGPMGPAVVTLDEFSDPDDLEIGCQVNGDIRQKARTSDMIFSVPALLAFVTGIMPLHPGDLIWTGTPPGVGYGRRPQVFLQSGDRLDTWIEGIGELHQTFT